MGIVEGFCWYRAWRVSIQGNFVLSKNPRIQNEGDRQVVKRSFEPWVAHPEVKVQVRDLEGRWAQETCAGCPQQGYTTGEPGKDRGRDHVGIVEGFCGYRARRVSIQGNFVLSRNPRIQNEGDRQVVKRSSDLRVAHPEVKVQVRDLVRVVGIVASLPRGGSVFGKICFIEPQRVDGHKRPVPGAPTGEPGKVQGRDRVDIAEGS